MFACVQAEALLRHIAPIHKAGYGNVTRRGMCGRIVARPAFVIRAEEGGGLEVERQHVGTCVLDGNHRLPESFVVVELVAVACGLPVRIPS